MTFTKRDPLFPEIISLHGRWRRSREAVICGGQRLSWAEFDQRLNRVANAAREFGLNEGDRAAVLMSNGLPMLEILFGLMKAGVTSVPLNPSVEDDALANMFKDAGATALFCTSDQAVRVDHCASLSGAASGSLKVVADVALNGWTEYTDWLANASGEYEGPSPHPDTPLNIIYSSGTTGTPKGIVHTQRGRKDWASDLAPALRYHGGARTLVSIGLYSNISWVSMLCTFLVGGTLVIERGFDAEQFWHVVDKERVTHSSMVPLQFSKIMRAEPGGADGSSLSAMMSAGSPLHPELKQRLLDRFGPAVIELYGLTEGVVTTLDPEVADGRLTSVGQPLLGTDIKIIDETDEEVPIGASGEIVATGRIVMPEYWNRPHATKDVEWVAPDGTVWLRTGDIGKIDEDGFLYIIDRKKDMILSGGQNIYPQDVEAKLITHPDVYDAAVIGSKSQKWGETPIGLVVAGEYGDAQQIRDWCNTRLGKQQRMADVIIVNDLPRNTNGKILKRELRALYGDRVYD